MYLAALKLLSVAAKTFTGRSWSELHVPKDLAGLRHGAPRRILCCFLELV